MLRMSTAQMVTPELAGMSRKGGGGEEACGAAGGTVKSRQKEHSPGATGKERGDECDLSTRRLFSKSPQHGAYRQTGSYVEKRSSGSGSQRRRIPRSQKRV